MGKMDGEFAPNSGRAAPQPPARPGPPPVAAPPPLPAPISGGGGRYQLDPEQLKALIGEWTALRDDLKTARDTARPLIQVEGPGKDFASKELARRANASGGAYFRHNQDMQTFCDDYIKKLTAALHAHVTNDERGAQAFNRTQA